MHLFYLRYFDGIGPLLLVNGHAGAVNHIFTLFNHAFCFQHVYHILEGIIGTYEFVVIEAPYAPNQIQCCQQFFVIGEDENVCFRTVTGDPKTRKA